MKEMLGGCLVCSDEMGWHDNPLIYCDGPGCEVAVHQGCYGIQEVPEGEWFCEKCRQTTSYDHHNGLKKSPHCVLCPLRFGALKRTEDGGWAHVVCALYIPEARFGDVHTMDPVILSEIPPDRFSKICYICMNNGENRLASQGACMGCHKPSCKRTFHVTCAQRKGLLCEEVGVSKTVKYCGFCANHLKKGIQDPSIKNVPACRIPARPTSRTHLSQPTPPSSNNSGHMLVDPIPRPDQVASVLGLSQPVSEDANLVNNFSPPLTTSSRSSVALDATPPLSNSLSQMKETNGPSTSLNALMNVAMGQNHNRICDSMPGVASPFERNGHMEEKPVVDAAFTMHTVTPTVSRANISKRPREVVKPVPAEKVKKPRTNNRQSKNMKALLDAVGPVVSETVSDFQRERAAVRSEAERRASHANTAPSTSHEAVPHDVKPQVPSTSAHVLGSSPSTSKESTLPSSMEQLLERQWDQGSQLLMSQAQFDVSQLLTCLHQLKSENTRLDEQLTVLTKRREHLLALNAKLSIPLTQTPTTHPPHATHHPPPLPMLGSPHHSPQVPLPTTEDSLSQMRSMAAGARAPNVQRPPSQPAQPPPTASFSTPQMHQSAHMRPPTATTVSSAALTTTPSSQNSTMPAAGDLANAISPERLVAMNPLASLGGNFLSQQRGLLPGMDHLVTQLLLQQAQQQLRFSQQNSSSAPTTTTASLFNLGNLIPPINGPQNGNPSK